MRPSIATGLAARTDELVGQRVPFVRATVVRAQHPTSAHAGDAAVILTDGTIEGFVGGECAESSVVTAALDVLDSGEPLLLRILPGEQEVADADAAQAADPDADQGARNVVNPCLSGGALEIFLAPWHPEPVVVVVGTSPVADALVALLPGLGFAAVQSTAEPSDCSGVLGLVVASHGHDEPASIRAALDAGVGFVGMVASQVRGEAVLATLGLTPAQRAVVRSPVGLDIGARTAPEIALSIAAELIEAVRRDGLEPAPGARVERPATALDPVCGMTVTVTPTTPHLRHDGVDHWFCGSGCLAGFRAGLPAEG